LAGRYLAAHHYGVKAVRVLVIGAMVLLLAACAGHGRTAAVSPPSRPVSPAVSQPVVYPATGRLLSTYFGAAAPAAVRIFGGVINFPRVGRITSGELVVVTAGSGSCPSVPTSVRVTGPSAVVIEVGTDGGSACTSDLRVTNNLITVPGLDMTKPAQIVLQYAPGGPTETGTLPSS
jgi:hypothetical protein